MDSCSHFRTIDDTTTGDCICLDCGKVIEQLLFNTQKCCLSESLGTDKHLYLLSEICENLNICSSVKSEILKTFLRACQQHHKNKDILIAFAIFDTLRILKMPDRLRDIELSTGIDRKHFLRVNNSENTATETNNTTASLEIYCVLLGLSYEAKKKIESFCNELMGLCSNSTNCILATVILLYCTEHKIEMTLKKICEVCDVSCESVRRLKKDLIVRNILPI